MAVYSGDAFYLQLRSKTIPSQYDRATGKFLTLTPSLGSSPANIAINDIQVKKDSLTYISAAEYIGVSSTTFTQCAPEATEFGEITQNKSHCADHGHSRSTILVPIESSYTTSY